MQGDVVPARHEDGYRFQAARPMEGDELVNPLRGESSDAPRPSEARRVRPLRRRRKGARCEASGGCPSSSGQERWQLPQNLTVGRILCLPRQTAQVDRQSTAQRRENAAPSRSGQKCVTPKQEPCRAHGPPSAATVSPKGASQGDRGRERTERSPRQNQKPRNRKIKKGRKRPVKRAKTILHNLTIVSKQNQTTLQPRTPT